MWNLNNINDLLQITPSVVFQHEAPMENRLAPFRFSIACQPSIPGGYFAPGEGNFEFDIFTGDGTIDGIPAFNMDISTGAVPMFLIPGLLSFLVFWLILRSSGMSRSMVGRIVTY